MKRLPSLLPAAAGSVLTAASFASAAPLEDYVAREDGALAFEVTETASLGMVKAYNVRLTSQEWRGIPWKHWLSVIVPTEVDDHKGAVLVIEGGSSHSGPPSARSPDARQFADAAVRIKAPVAILQQVPNQPLFDDLYEDDLIAHTFAEYLKDGDATWPLLLPMVKSAVRAMDALEALADEGKLAGPSGDAVAIEKFAVTGASKRGWTTWLTSAVDDRVIALAPMVIDVLNMKPQMERQQRTYGRFSEMIEPYTKRGVQEKMTTPAGEKLREIVDPYHYLDQIDEPVLVLLGTNDRYWTADAASLYFDDIGEPRGIHYLPNAGHGLGPEIRPTLLTFLRSSLRGEPFPSLETETADGKIKVAWNGEGKAELWQATSPNRDFREAVWIAEPVEAPNGSCAVALNPASEDGWTASFISVTFSGEGGPVRLCSPIAIVPETFPHDPPAPPAAGQ